MRKRFRSILSVLSKTERAVFLTGLAVAAASSVILIFILISTKTVAAPARGGEYTEGIVGQPTFVNPVIASTEVDKSLIKLIFENLNELGEKIEPNKDGRSWTVRLKDGLYWQDGKELTSDDVIFTVQKIQDPDSRSPLSVSWQGVLAQRISEREIQFNLGTPYAFFENNLKNLYILPKHLFVNIPVANWRISTFNLKPVGSGPYQFDSLETKSDGFISSYSLKVNPRYAGDLPYIQKFRLKMFPQKEDLMGAFNSGRIDGLAGLDYEDLAGIKRPYKTFHYNLPNYYAVFINQSQNIALKELSVREAMSLGLDKKELLAQVLGNKAEVADGPIPPGIMNMGANPILGQNSSSVEYGNKILEDAGWAIKEDGIRQKTIKKSDIKLEFNLAVPQVPFLIATAEWLKNSWGKMGIKINLEELPIDDTLNQTIKNREYQMILFGNILNSGFDLFPFWHSSERFFPGLNLSIYNSGEADSLIEKIRQNFDPESRREQLIKLQNVITKDYPAVFLYSPNYLYIISSSKNLRGLGSGLINEPADRFQNVSLWYLKTQRVFSKQ